MLALALLAVQHAFVPQVQRLSCSAASPNAATVSRHSRCSLLIPFSQAPYCIEAFAPCVCWGPKLLSSVLGHPSNVFLVCIILPAIAASLAPRHIRSFGSLILQLAARIQMVNDAAKASLQQFHVALGIQPQLSRPLPFLDSVTQSGDPIPKMDRAAFRAQMRMQHELAKRRNNYGPAMYVRHHYRDELMFESREAKWHFFCKATVA